MNQPVVKVLLIDDDEDDYVITRNLLKKIEGGNFEIEWEPRYASAAEKIKENRHNIYLIDYSLGEHNGVDLVRLVVETGCNSLVIMLTGQGERKIDIEAISAGASDYLLKGSITPSALERSFRHAFERKRSAEELRLSEERYRALVENSLGLICTHDLEGRLLSINPAAADALGYKADEIVGRNMAELLPADSESGYRDYLVAIARDSVGSGLMRLVKVDGKEAIWEYRNSLFVEPGKSPYVLGYAHDVTESKRFEKALRESEERYRDLFENSSDLIQIADPDGLIVYVNSVWKRVLGFNADEVTYFSFFDIVSPDSRGKCVEVFGRALAGEKIDYFEATFITKDGRAIAVEGSITCSFKHGKATSAQGIFHDITERKLLETELHRTRDGALEATRLKSEFLANMSHEIRTPMNGVIGMTEILLNTELTPVQKATSETILASAESLLVIINDILDFSKIEAGKLDFSSVNFNLSETLCETMRILAVRACGKGLELLYCPAENLSEELVGDPGRLRQVIVNLVSNAIKFTERGEVVLRVEKICDDNDETVLQFSVIDTGIGISIESQSRIFEPFIQAEDSTVRLYGGTGLGLSISQRLIEKMGGRIWIESNSGEGSKFHFTARFKVQEGAGPGLAPTVHSKLRNMPVLVVDDNETNRQLLYDLLSTWQMKPSVVEGGRVALETLTRAKDMGEPFSLVIVDADMPELNGLLLSKEISLRPGLAEQVILMLRPDNNGDSCPEGQGIALCLTKPVRPADLLNAITMVFGLTQEQTAQSVQIPSVKAFAHHSPLRVLLAEDNVVNQRVAVAFLEKQGHSVTVAANGKIALSVLSEEQFDLVLMDVQMPVMNGFEAVAAIREQERKTGAHLPIIAMTAFAMNGDKERCIAAGMDSYLAKPIHAKDLFQGIETLMSDLATAASGGQT